MNLSRCISLRKALGCAFLALIIFTIQATILPSGLKAQNSGFVTRNGNQLMLNGQPFHFAGTNMGWVLLDTSALNSSANPGTPGTCSVVVSTGDPVQIYNCYIPSQFEVHDGFLEAKELGATVVRTFLDVGCDQCLLTGLRTYNETAFRALDNVLAEANSAGIRMILTPVSEYHFYLGGLHTFTDFEGLTDPSSYNQSTAASIFFNNPSVIADYEDYLNTLMNRTNTVTGVVYKNDPTILAWETANEVHPPTVWTQTIADYIKGVDTNHLVADGYNQVWSVQAADLSIANVDLYSDHWYPRNAPAASAQTVASAGKAYFIGEYDWSDTDYPNPNYTLAQFTAAIEQNTNIAGDTFWQLAGRHADNYGIVGEDGSLNTFYPGATSDRRSRVQTLRTHGYTMRGQSAPATGIPAAPVITSVTGTSVGWRGNAPADTYTIQRSTTSATAGFTTICNTCVTDLQAPWTDSTQPSGTTVWYRIQGVNLSGVAGDFSAAFQTGASGNGNSGSTYSGCYRITNAQTGSQLWQTGDQYNSNTNVWNVVDVPGGWSGNSSIWQLSSNGSGYYTIGAKGQDGQLWLTGDNYGSGTGNFYVVTAPSAWGGDNGLWKITSASGNYVNVVSKANSNVELKETGDTYNGNGSVYYVAATPASVNLTQQKYSLTSVTCP